MDNLYGRIAELCEIKKITVYRLCKDIGIRPSVLTDLKSGRKKGLSATTAQKIASHLGVSVEYLLGETDTKEKTPAVTGEGHSKEAIQFLERFKDLPPEAWEELAAFAEFQAAKHKHTER